MLPFLLPYYFVHLSPCITPLFPTRPFEYSKNRRNLFDMRNLTIVQRNIEAGCRRYQKCEQNTRGKRNAKNNLLHASKWRKVKKKVTWRNC